MKDSGAYWVCLFCAELGGGGILREHIAGPKVLCLSQFAFEKKARGRKVTHQICVLSPVGD